MDIFTTQLTRVVPVPIKPANLKVKALLKDAGSGKLKEDPDHLENHDLYFSRVKEKRSDDADKKEQEPKQEKEQEAQQQFNDDQNEYEYEYEYERPIIKRKTSNTTKEKHLLDDEGKPTKHLDIYI